LFVFRDISLNGNLRYNGSFLKNISVNLLNIGSGNSVYDTIFGYLALKSVPSGSIAEKNTAIGFQSLILNSTGTNNSSFGDESLWWNTGSLNTAVGRQALLGNRSGSNNTAIGYQAGNRNRTGTNNTYIGTQSDAAGDNYSNSTAIGYLSSITRSNEIVLGTASEIFIINRIERHLAPPIIMRKATSAQTQGISHAVDTFILFPTSVYDNGFTGLGYVDASGSFRNNNTYPISVYISASVNIPANSTGLRATFIETFDNATYLTGRLSIMDDRAVNTTLSHHVSAITPLQAGASFAIRLYQTTGAVLTINGTDATNYPTTISIRVF